MTGPEPAHTRVNDCGCVETWHPIEGGCEGSKRYAYGLWVKCEEHTARHAENIAIIEQLRAQADGPDWAAGPYRPGESP